MGENDKTDDYGFNASIPVWDGRADSLREFKKTVKWWLHSVNLEKTTGYNLAARFAMKQTGSAKMRALEFTPDELAYTPAEEYTDPDSGETIVVTPADYAAGINKILAAWDEMIGRTVNDRKGELREKFYLATRRGQQESVVAFSLRYRTLVGEMRAEGITIDDAETAWFYKQKLALNEMQKQMLETTLGTSTEVYADCEREAVRLFKRMHFGATGDGGQHHPGHRRPGLTSSALSKFRRSLPSSSSSTASSWTRRSMSSKGAHSAYVADAEPTAEEDENWQEDSQTNEEHETYETQ